MIMILISNFENLVIGIPGRQLIFNFIDLNKIIREFEDLKKILKVSKLEKFKNVQIMIFLNLSNTETGKL